MEGFAGKKLKKWVSIGMGILLCFLSACSCAGETADNSRIPDELKNLYACSAVLMDGDSGRVLFGKNEKEALPMASTTKIMYGDGESGFPASGPFGNGDGGDLLFKGSAVFHDAGIPQ